MRKLSWILAFVFFVSSFVVLNACGEAKTKTTYNINCELQGNKLTGEEEVYFFNDTDNAFSCLKFNVYPNAYRENAKFSPINSGYYHSSYYDGVSYGNMEISAVKCQNNDLNFSITGEDENILCVELKEEVFPDEGVTVSIYFTVTLAKVISRTGLGKKTVNLGNFYPVLCGIQNQEFYECVYYDIGDPFFSDVADYYVTFTFDSDYLVASSGEIISAKKENDKDVVTYYGENIRSFALNLSKDYETITGSVGDISVHYYYYNDDNPVTSMEYITNALTTFENLFGEFPYRTYSVVQSEFLQGGMEYSALAIVGDDLEREALNEVIVHETAHMWWQGGVGNNQVEYGFLDEALAEYSVVLFFENNPKYNRTRKELMDSSEKTYKMYSSVMDELFGKTNKVMARSLKDFDSEYEYVCTCYVKGAIMLDLLRETVGENCFFKGLKRYYESMKYKVANPDDFISSFNRFGVDVEGFLKSFYEGKTNI